MGVRKLLERGFSRSSSSSSSVAGQSYGPAMMCGRMKEVESIIARWDVEAPADGSAASDSASSSTNGSLFDGRRGDARRFFHAVSDLDHFMRYLNTAKLDRSSSTGGHSDQDDFVSTRRLMEMAMKRLQKEFFRLLSADGQDRFDSDSGFTVTSCSGGEEEEDVKCHAAGQVGHVATATTLLNLRLIANSMVSAGYAKECAKVYKNVRKSVVDERIYRLGFQRLSQSQIEKLDVASAEHWIKTWLGGAVVAIKTIFAGERSLCDSVFDSSEKIREFCFAEITRDAAVQFLEFPMLVASAASAATYSSPKKATRKWKSKSHSPSPRRIFYLLDLHNCITDLWPAIEKVFSYGATSSVQSQAISSLETLGVSVGHMLADFENTIRKDSGKEPAVPGGGLHPLTRLVMDVLVVLSEYSLALDDIYFHHPLPTIEPTSSSSSVSARFAWLVLVLLSKLDTKAELYKDTSLSYLFLANNFQYIARKVAANDKLRRILGDEWVKKHEDKVRSFVRSYERVGWAKKVAAMEEDEIQVFAE